MRPGNVPRQCPQALGTAHLVHLGLGRLLEGVEHHVQVFLELAADGQRDVPEHREDLRLHRPVHVLVLGEKNPKRARDQPGKGGRERGNGLKVQHGGLCGVAGDVSPVGGLENAGTSRQGSPQAWKCPRNVGGREEKEGIRKEFRNSGRNSGRKRGRDGETERKRNLEGRNLGIQEGIQDEIQEFRNSGSNSGRNSGIQEFKKEGIQGGRNYGINAGRKEFGRNSGRKEFRKESRMKLRN